MELNAQDASPLILTVNGGSSSIKFAIFAAGDPPKRKLFGQVERIGDPDAQIVARAQGDATPIVRPINATDYRGAAQGLIDFLHERVGRDAIVGVGHRVVHGGVHLLENQRVTAEMVAELRRNEPLDLAHLPREIALIESFGKAFPGVPQVACFDTAFHRDLPRVAKMLPIPRHYFDEGVRRFGFHGLSYTYLMRQLAAVAGPEAASGRVILAHLGSGASMAAVKNGKPIDTTMAFTPTAGLVMGTRPGDLDPGLLVYLMRTENLSCDQMDQFISQRCGLLGISETTFDMRDLLGRRASDPRAADAVALFCYQARKFIGALAAALGGIDTLVFSGGIGEHAAECRAEICQGMDWLGILLDSKRNAETAPIISRAESRVAIRVIATDEEIVIATAVGAFLK